MPYGDGTGPMGRGPMTGRAAGYCAGYGLPGYASAIGGGGMGARMGWGGGWGRGWRWRNWYYGAPDWAPLSYVPPLGYAPYAMPPTREQQAELLSTQAKALQQELDAINRRLEELEQTEGD